MARGNSSGFYRQLVAVAVDERVELAGVPIAWQEAARLGQGAEEPAEVELVRPDGNENLVSTEEGNGRSDAMDCGQIAQVLLEI